jgi:NNP family nitrate/nitrite transporter-like MFS transporter
VDHLRDHRDEDKGRAGPERHPVRLLVGTPILTGSLVRLFLGVWTDQYGGRIVFPLTMLASAASTFLLSHADTYPLMLLAALGLGLAGGGFAVGVAYVSKWYPQEKQGSALGFFGMGNVGAAVTKFVAPWVMVAMGWQAVAQIWAAALLAIAVLFFLLAKDDPELAERRRSGQSRHRASRSNWNRSGTNRSGASRSIISSCSAPSSHWPCGCRNI